MPPKTHGALEVASEFADQTVLIEDMRDCLRFFVRMTEADVEAGAVVPGETRLKYMKRANELLALISKRINREG